MFGLFKKRKEKKLQAIRDAIAHNTHLVFTAATVFIDPEVENKYPPLSAIFAAYTFGIIDYFGQQGDLNQNDTFIALGIFYCRYHGVSLSESYELSLKAAEIAMSSNGIDIMKLGGIEAGVFVVQGNPPMGLKNIVDQVIDSVEPAAEGMD